MIQLFFCKNDHLRKHNFCDMLKQYLLMCALKAPDPHVLLLGDNKTKRRILIKPHVRLQILKNDVDLLISCAKSCRASLL